jgi:hypothetical protein
LNGNTRYRQQEEAAVRMSRWRPVCPECGYSLRGLEKPRCPECGVDLPSANRTFRRWAIRRNAWDRLHRGSLLTAYIGTLLCVLFAPWRVGQHLAIPDHWGRAIRWALFHLLLCALGAVLLSQEDYYVWQIADRLHPIFEHHITDFHPWDANLPHLSLWAAQTLFAWMLVLASFPITGVLLSLVVPTRHRAAKLTSAKWSLYSTPVLAGALAAWYVHYLIWPDTSYNTNYYHPPLSLEPLVWVYALWWAAGMSMNQYGRRAMQGPPALVFWGLLYGCVWPTVVYLLFPGGLLEALL